ncbi:MAG: hypothetical protein KY446_09230 [Proteobacteria bacterium]|nr:hypothetical protein [Pseudomonadota bacterium]MBW3617919.1 hypothetical protein [Pseudomonadota bacterium]
MPRGAGKEKRRATEVTRRPGDLLMLHVMVAAFEGRETTTTATSAVMAGAR